MARIAWASDLHLNFALPQSVEKFVAEVRAADADMLVLCGDLSGGASLRNTLELLELELNCLVRFVLGNHDYYRSSFGKTREAVREVVANSLVGLFGDGHLLEWISDGRIERLSDDAVLIGHDGWYDARAGLLRNRVILNDFYEIEDLRPFSARALVPEPLVLKIRGIADEAAAYLDAKLPEALGQARRVVLATHVPPFPQAAWHDGRQSEPDYLPFFCSVCAGNVLVKHMEANPDKELLVLCGHTHGEGEAQILPNLKVLTARAEYGKPRLQGVIDV